MESIGVRFMISLIVGHRGVGKTQFLHRIEQHYRDVGKSCKIIDLDREIELHEERSVFQIFSEDGEKRFREIENKMLADLIRAHQSAWSPVFIALGAGCKPVIGSDINVIWLRRETDKDGRIFKGRPRLNPDMTAYDEYMQRFSERESLYSNLAHSVYIMGEGLDHYEEFEKVLLGLKKAEMRGAMTLLPHHFKSESIFKEFVHQRLDWGVSFLELRDDLLNPEMVQICLKHIPVNKKLLSFRDSKSKAFEKVDVKPSLKDWALENGKPPWAPTILSLHELSQGESIQQSITRLESAGEACSSKFLKFSPLIKTFSDLYITIES